MRFLIVEDDELKSGRICEFLRATYSDARLETAQSVHSGVRALTQAIFDLVVLDMTLPAFDAGPDEDGGTRKPYGGRELLRQMEARDLTTPAIVVTQFDRFGEGDRSLSLAQLDAQLAASFSNYHGAVQYRAEFEGWKESLGAKMRSVLAEAQS